MDENKALILLGGAIAAIYIGAKLGLSGILIKSNFEKRRGLIIPPLRGKLRLTSPFGWRVHPVTGEQSFHNGVDLVLREGVTFGAPIVAPYSGTIGKNWFDEFGGYSVRIDNGIASFGFAHLKEKSNLPVGTKVKRGQIVGYVGNSGRSTAPHLHYTFRLNNVATNPLTELPRLKTVL